MLCCIPLIIIDAVLKFSGRRGLDKSWKKNLEAEIERYDEQALCHYRAKMSLAYSFCAMISLLGAVFFGEWTSVLAQLPLLCAVIFDRKYFRDYGSVFEKRPPDDERDAAASKRRSRERKVWLGVTCVTVTAFAAIFAYAESDPRIEIDYISEANEMGLIIGGLHGTRVPISRINGAALFEESFEVLFESPGMPVVTGFGFLGRNYQTFGAMKGHFWQGLLYVQPRQSPTLRIEYYHPLPPGFYPEFLLHNIFISLHDADAVRELYARLTGELEPVVNTRNAGWKWRFFANLGRSDARGPRKARFWLCGVD